MDFLEHMALACLFGALFGLALLAIGGLFEIIDFFSKGRFKKFIVNLFSEE